MGLSRPDRRDGGVGALSVALLILCVASSTASAQDGFDAQNFKPALSRSTSYVTSYGADVAPHGTGEVGVLLHHADDPLGLYDRDGDRIVRIVRAQTTLELHGSYALLDRLELGLAIPVIVSQVGEADIDPTLSGDDAGAGLGDLRLALRGHIWRQGDEPGARGVTLGATLAALLPTSSQSDFQGGDFRAEPRIAAEYIFGERARIGTNLGLLIRSQSEVVGLEVDETFTWALAGEVALDPAMRWRLVPEIAGGVSFSDDLRGEEAPIEAILGAKYEPLEWMQAEAGFGTGLNGGFGAPDWRLYAGLSFRLPPDTDRDGDGLRNSVDACPAEPEDLDDFEDDDGCPDPDDDGDGVLDVDDACRAEAEDLDGYVDGDGCPDPDNDRDGVLDAEDACPNEPEDVDGFEDRDGCPDPDNDNDQILDERDACPDQAEDIDGFEEMDGCPEPDNDLDGFLDLDDMCMNEPEDFDGFEDDDGCPEEGEGLVELTCDSIEIRESVYFATGSDAIEERSNALLDQIAGVLNANPYVLVVRIEGHTDDRGSEASNLVLSQERAASVLRAMVDRGVEGGRLTSEGYGESTPVADNNTRDGRRLNRRVEFVIVEQENRCGE